MAKVTIVLSDDPEKGNGALNVSMEFDPPLDKGQDPTSAQSAGFWLMEQLNSQSTDGPQNLEVESE